MSEKKPVKPPGMQHDRRPSMSDVARASGYSRSTVDRVLNGRARVRDDTGERIRAAAESLGFYAAGVIRERLRDVRPRRSLGFLLQLPEAAFYQGLAAALTHATETCSAIRGRPVIEFLKNQSPDVVAAHLEDLGRRVDALAVVTADHPAISEAILNLKRQGVPVFALISDLSSLDRAGYAGLENRRVGRTAAWLITEMAREPGPLAIYVGSHRFQCQELTEISFRSYIREHAPQFELLETITTLESEQYGEERTHELLRQHPHLVGLYMGGSGIEGVLKALRSRRSNTRLIGVGNDLTAITRSGLLDGRLHCVLSHPLALLCPELVAQMADVLANPAPGLRQVLVPLEIWTRENV